MKQYKVIRIDMETYKNFIDKQQKVNGTMKGITGKNKNIPLTKVIKLSSASPILYMGNNALIKSLKGKK